MVEFSVCYFMDNFVYSAVSYLANFAYDYPIITLFLSLIITFGMGHVHFSKLLCNSRTYHLNNNYDYGPESGPHTWKTLGPNQSPVDIRTNLFETLMIREQLMWNHYDDLPVKVTLENNGRTVIMKAKYASNTPTISGAELFYSYTFESLCFHWSFLNTDGSEHTTDGQKFAMELQATHRSVPTFTCVVSKNLLTIAYLFQVSTHNPFLDPIVLNLHRIREPGSVIEIDPFPLAWLCYQFKSGFYSYGGSTSTPPCEEGVEWFVNPEPMSISESQLMEFRSLLSSDGKSRITRNSRPVQCLNANRVVQYNKYNMDGSSLTLNRSQSHLSNGNESDE